MSRIEVLTASGLTTLSDLLRTQARERSAQPAYTFLDEGEHEGPTLTFAELYVRARALGARLEAAGFRGERALLLYPPGLDFIVAFFGCLLAGVVAVPAYPPRTPKKLPRLRSILLDARPALALTTTESYGRFRRRARQLPELEQLEWLATDGELEDPGEAWIPPTLAGSSAAFLQYTSGSTSQPKGVVVTHSNLLHNEEMIRRSFEQSEDSVIVGWLPLYHDMGLIGNVLQPLFVGARCVLMSPMAFLSRPRRWLEAITRYRATTSGGPDFAYELCVRKVGPESRQGLDLSSWRVAFNGAEPVRAATLERFAAAFAECGFRPEAFYPCYGLAEATLFVTGGSVAVPPRVEGFSAPGIEEHRALPASGPAARELVGCGFPSLGQELVIADPESRTRCAPQCVGEIWVAGPSVASGYWQRPEATEETFRARLADDPEAGPFLRTGDLGFVRDRELFVTGRRKDLVILRGRNLYPQDIEETVEHAHPAVRPGGAAAFSVDVTGEEQLVVAVEVARRSVAPLEEVAEAVRRAVSEEHELSVQEVVLLKTGTLPKTSSGKVRRHACRISYLEGSLDMVCRLRPEPAEGLAAELAANGLGLSPETLLGLEPAERLPFLLDHLRREVAWAARMPVDRVDPGEPLVRLGLDSLAAAGLGESLEGKLGIALPLADLLDDLDVSTLARRLLEEIEIAGETAVTAPAAGVETDWIEKPSRGQQALWFLARLAPESGAYHIAAAARVRPALDVAALRRALGGLIARHPALRTLFPGVAGAPRRRVQPWLEPELVELDASGLEPGELAGRLADEAHRPFNLETGSLVRVVLLRRSSEEDAVVLAVHHIVADFWSMAIFVRDLAVLYAAEIGAAEAALEPAALGYGDYVRWQEALLAGADGQRLWDYWHRQLAGPLPTLELPTDRPRPPLQTFRGAARVLTLGPAATSGAEALARQSGATLFMVLLAAFQALLHRYSHQRVLLVGSPILGRSRREFVGVVGYFVNPLVLRAEVGGDPPFGELADQVRVTCLEAFAHQDYPFPLLAEKLQAGRDASRSPVFQVMFQLQETPVRELRGLELFALGRPGGRLMLGALDLESLELPERASQFDLTLRLAHGDEGLIASVQYNVDLFDTTTMDRFLSRYRELLLGAVADPGRTLAELPLEGPAARHQMLVAWNDGWIVNTPERPAHVLFEAQATLRPDAVAVTGDPVAFAGGVTPQLTYGELDARADRLARRLRQLGVGPEVRVGIALERDPEMLVGLLAVFKAGGAYVPLDPSFPKQRLAFMLEDSGAALVVTQRRVLEALAGADVPTLLIDAPEPAGGEVAGELGGGVGLENLAYLIYTSGSTGRPKGVQITRGALVNFLAAMGRRPGLESGDVLLAVTTLSFDIAVLELFLPLVTGARVVITRRETAADGRHLGRCLEAARASVMQATPATWTMLLESGWPGAELEALCGGEALSPVLAQRLKGRVAGLWNVYGPTETTVWSAVARVGQWRRRVPVGRPIDNTEIYLVDRGLRPVAVGIEGELMIGGRGLARGYMGRPGLTAERFVPDLFSPRPGSRLYRTGDLARFLPDGEVEVLGRADHQVKVRGFRIEPGEIEAALDLHPAVAEAVVTACGEAGGDRSLVAYVEPSKGGAAPAPQELRAFLSESLPEYMVPQFFVVLEELPRTPNRKIDRAALPAPAPRGGEGLRAPRTQTEELLAEIWCELLGLDRVGSDEDFFLLGGHSLKATQLLSRVRDVFGVEIPLTEFFVAPTVARLAQRVESAFGAGSDGHVPRLEPRPQEGARELSFAQQRLWFLDQLEPGSPLYNIVDAVEISGRLSVADLERGFAEVVRRHETLRTTFPESEGRAVQVVAPRLEIPLRVVDLAALGAAHRDAERQRLTSWEARRPFDLAAGPLLRLTLLRLGPDEHLLLLAVHHIVSDGWSMGVMIAEVGEVYRALCEGEAPRLAALPIRYVDFAHWQSQWMASEGFRAQLDYWRRQLDRLPVLELPVDRPRPRVENFRGAKHPFVFDPELSVALQAVAREQKVTLYMVLLAVFAALLRTHSRQPEVVVGSPIANRNRQETEGLIGFFANTLVMRANLAGDPRFAQVLDRLRGVTLEAFAHQDVPFERLVDELQPERDMSRNPLFQVMLVLQNAPLPASELPGLTLRPRDVDSGTAKFDLTLFFWQEGERLAGILEYSTALFDRSTVLRLLEHFENLARRTAAEPLRRLSEIAALGDAERHQVVVEWNDTDRCRRLDRCVHEWVEERVMAVPEAVALVDGERALSYQELNIRANKLAHYLRGCGVEPEMLVGICVSRSWEMVVALLAVLKAGGAGVALDPTYPEDRLRYVVTDARLAVLLTESSLLPYLPTEGLTALCLDRGWEGFAAESAGDPPAAARLANPMYAIYTSGSTGLPKGICVTHRAFMNLLTWQLHDSRLSHRARTLQFATFGFCVSFQEIFSSLCSGGTLVLVPEPLRRDIEGLCDFLAERGIDRLHVPFAALKQLADVAQLGKRVPATLREVITAGEQLQLDRSIRELFDRLEGCALHNQYGASETHVVSSFTLGGSPESWPDICPIGRPVANTAIHLLDGYLRPVPVGVAGELFAAEPCLPRSYLNDSQLTASKLIPNPFSRQPGTRLYRTGDLARTLADGNIEYFGRIDTQVKIRGFRVELGEVEMVLKLHPSVRDGAVVAHEDGSGGQRLAAYVVFHDGEPRETSLADLLKERLPEYMIPAAIVPMEALPLNANGKLDRGALPRPEVGRLEGDRTFVAPRDPVEELVAQVWRQVLGLSEVGVYDNFFKSGGHSLLATQVISRVRGIFQAELPLRALFESPTVAEMARAVVAHEGKPGQSEKIARILLKVKGKGTVSPASGGGTRR